MHDRLYRYIKKPIALLLMFAMLAQVFSKAIIVLSYQANKTYIAQNLCENRKTPGSHCAGKCQLRKKLEKDKQEDKKNLEKKTKAEQIAVLVFIETPTSAGLRFNTIPKQSFPSLSVPIASASGTLVFRPPIV